MNCPPEVASIIAEIIRRGLLQFRAAGWNGDSDLAAQIADHLHNLPGTLFDYQPESLAYYWEAERPSFVAAVDESISRPYQSCWDQLKPHVPETALSEATG